MLLMLLNIYLFHLLFLFLKDRFYNFLLIFLYYFHHHIKSAISILYVNDIVLITECSSGHLTAIIFFGRVEVFLNNRRKYFDHVRSGGSSILKEKVIEKRINNKGNIFNFFLFKMI